MGRISLKTEEEIKMLREGGKILKECLELMEAAAKPGMSTGELNEIGEKILEKHGVEGAFKGYHGFPAATCISLNDEAVHGIPSYDRIMKEGDIVGLDFGVVKDGLITDSCRTIAIGEISKEARKLMDVCEEALRLGLEQAVSGNKTGDIAGAIQPYVESFGYGVVRELIGHGVGHKVHEAPEVPNHGRAGTGVELVPGLVIAVEPIITEGDYKVKTLGDRWTVVTKDGSLSAHFEHSVAILEDGQLILTD
jgi:methionyl aminopeptidase